MYHEQPEATALTEEELALYLKLQKKVGWRRTGTEVFQSFFPILPFVPFELAVVREVGSKMHVLMWHRNDKHYCGWHMPGGYTLRGETDRQVVERVLSKETGLKLQFMEFIRCFNTRPESGWVPNHQMAKFYYCLAEGEPTVGQFFPIDSIPIDTLWHHIRFVEHLRAFLLRKETMMWRGIHYDGLFTAPEGRWLVAETKGGWLTTAYKSLTQALEAVRKSEQSSRRIGIKGTLEKNIHLFEDEGRQIL